MEVLIKILVATYTVCLPVLVKWLHQLRKEKKEAHTFMVDSVGKMSKAIDKMNNKMIFDEAMTSRYRIIRAADEIRNGEDLSDDHIEQLGEDIEIYKKYCDTHDDYLNHKGQRSMKILLDYENIKMKGSANDV